jgi:hypothetical protein
MQEELNDQLVVVSSRQFQLWAWVLWEGQQIMGRTVGFFPSLEVLTRLHWWEGRPYCYLHLTEQTAQQGMLSHRHKLFHERSWERSVVDVTDAPFELRCYTAYGSHWRLSATKDVTGPPPTQNLGSESVLSVSFTQVNEGELDNSA